MDLKKQYRLLFRAPKGYPISSFGFECDIGWYSLIHGVCEQMYADYSRTRRALHVYKTKITNKDYNEFFTEEAVKDYYQKYKNELKEHKSRLPYFVQIKEKFGTLRLYIDGCYPYINGVIDMAEHMSSHICEKCGQIGKTYSLGWHKTLCLDHAIANYGTERVADYNNAN